MTKQNGRNTSVLLLGISAICFAVSVWAMSPGWMTLDSFTHFVDARNGVYRDLFPVLVSWIWNKLLFVDNSPLPMLILNLAPYWIGFYYLSEAAHTRVGRWATLVPLLGFWPGIFEQVGFIWKDIIFAVMMLFGWSVVIAAHFQHRALRLWERIALPVAMTIAVGVKPNGLTAVPFLFGAWLYVEGSRTLLRTSLLSIGASVAVTAAAIAITMPSKIIRHENLMWQYTQIYDLLGISALSGNVVLPTYITAQRSSDPTAIRRSYWPGGIGPYFFHSTGGSLASSDPAQKEELFSAWVGSIREYPNAYLAHRWGNLSAMMRLGEYTPAWVGEPGIIETDITPKFRENFISLALAASIKAMPWAYLPWVYASIALVALTISVAFQRDRVLPVLMAASSGAFFAPHFFLLPAADYRYLYYCYLMAIGASMVAAVGLKREMELQHASIVLATRT